MCHPRIGRYNSAAVLPSPATDVLLGASEKSPSRKLLNKAFAACLEGRPLKMGTYILSQWKMCVYFFLQFLVARRVFKEVVEEYTEADRALKMSHIRNT
jgi:hypothetical protein